MKQFVIDILMMIKYFFFVMEDGLEVYEWDNAILGLIIGWVFTCIDE